MMNPQQPRAVSPPTTRRRAPKAVDGATAALVAAAARQPAALRWWRVLLAASVAAALVPPAPARARRTAPRRRVEFPNFGDVFYMGAEYEYPNGPREPLPEGTWEIALKRPCGIVFEERDGRRGVEVAEVVDGGNAAAQGSLRAGDVLVGVSAIRCIGAKFQREMFDATDMDFETVVEAIGSNEPKWKCEDVLLQFTRPAE